MGCPRTLNMGSFATYVLFLLCLVNLSEQTSSNDNENALEKILGKLADMEYKLRDMDSRLRKMDDYFANDIKGKFENLEVEVQAIKSQGTVIIEAMDLIKQDDVSSNPTDKQKTVIIEAMDLIKQDDVSSNPTDKQKTGADRAFDNATITMIRDIVHEKSLMTINAMNISLYVGQDLILDCGVIGWYISCFWMHDGAEYQISDIKQGSYPNIVLNSNGNSNQCGIVISSVTMDHIGDWSCNVLTKAMTLKATKTITVEKTTLIFDQANITAHITEEVSLECGVDGAFKSCSWEHSGDIYQVADIRNGSHLDMKADMSNVRNQCGITINSFKISHNGGWTCKVVTYGQPLIDSKNVGCREGFFKSKGSDKCYKFFKDVSLPWSQARTKCKEEGLEQAKNTDAFAIALRKDLTDTYYGIAEWYGPWLDARGTADGKMMWMTDLTQVTPSNPLWYQGYGKTIADYECLGLLLNTDNMNRYPEAPYYTTNCRNKRRTLCQEP